MTTPQPAALPEHSAAIEQLKMAAANFERAASVPFVPNAGGYAQKAREIRASIAALQSQPAAAGVSDADLYGTLEATIVSRYIVEKRVGGGFWGYCVKAGDGAQEIFVGHKNACEHVRQALQTACLDGAYMAHEKARAILALRPQAVPMTELPDFDELPDDAIDNACAAGGIYRADLMRAWESLRADGITAPAGGEGKA